MGARAVRWNSGKATVGECSMWWPSICLIRSPISLFPHLKQVNSFQSRCERSQTTVKFSIEMWAPTQIIAVSYRSTLIQCMSYQHCLATESGAVNKIGEVISKQDYNHHTDIILTIWCGIAQHFIQFSQHFIFRCTTIYSKSKTLCTSHNFSLACQYIVVSHCKYMDKYSVVQCHRIKMNKSTLIPGLGLWLGYM